MRPQYRTLSRGAVVKGVPQEMRVNIVHRLFATSPAMMLNALRTRIDDPHANRTHMPGTHNVVFSRGDS